MMGLNSSFFKETNKVPWNFFLSKDGWIEKHFVAVAQVHFLRVAETGTFESRSTEADVGPSEWRTLRPGMSQQNEKQNDGVKFQLSCDGLLKRMKNCFSTQITLFILIRS